MVIFSIFFCKANYVKEIIKFYIYITL